MNCLDRSTPRRQQRTARCAASHGFTLVELMVAIALATILLSLSVPSFTQTVARMRVEGASHNLATDLQLARSEALQRRVTVNLATAADGASYTVASALTPLKTVTLPGGVTFSGGVTISFDPLRGLANAATLTSTSSGTSAQLRVSSDLMGRVQMCSPAGGFKGYASC